jgi:hypothetical protein
VERPKEIQRTGEDGQGDNVEQELQEGEGTWAEEAEGD